jgi:hypothetical protein
MASPAPIAESEAKAFSLLQKLIEDNDLHGLEILLGKFNLFDALNLVRHEIRHSAILAYLLSPHENHGLGDTFLKAFLQRALSANNVDGLTPIDIHVWNLSDAEVQCEWQCIDIFIRDETHRLAVIIENKIGSTEHDDQLNRYLELVREKHIGWSVVSIYLTVEGETPTNEQYISIGYGQVCKLIESIVELRKSRLDPDVVVLIEHYVEMLRRHFLEESKIAKLCQKLYARHKEALDLIYEHRPDRLQHVRELLESEINKNPELGLDHSSKSAIRFIPKKIDLPIHGKGWTASGRMLLFEIENVEESLAVKLIIGPGEAAVREKLFDLAKQKPFSGTTKLYKQWTTIYRHRLLSNKDYALEDSDFDDKLVEEWKAFLEKDLPPLIGAFNSNQWVQAALNGTLPKTVEDFFEEPSK